MTPRVMKVSITVPATVSVTVKIATVSDVRDMVTALRADMAKKEETKSHITEAIDSMSDQSIINSSSLQKKIKI